MKRMTLLLSAVVLVAAILVGGTYAYFVTTMNPATNVVQIGKVTIDLTPTTNNIPTDVKIYPGIPFETTRFTVTNSGSTDAFIRVKLEPKDPTVTSLSEIAIKDDNWKLREDGYYYYRVMLTPKEKQSFTGSLMVDPAVTEGGVNVDISVKAEAIQADYLEDKDSQGYPLWPSDVDILKAK